jgi:hypothetical protein
LSPGANPTIVSYNASSVKIYDAKSSFVRLENNNIFFSLLKSALVYYVQRWRRCSGKFISRRMGSWNRFYILISFGWNF